MGYALFFSIQYKGECGFRVHPKSVAKMKQRIRDIMKRSNGWGNEFRIQKLKEYIRGWINYYKLADMKSLMLATDEWLRRKIRAVYWKQWKKVRTRYKMLKKLNIPEWKVHEIANCRKGIWRSAFVLNSILTKERIANLGYISMADYYLQRT